MLANIDAMRAETADARQAGQNGDGGLLTPKQAARWLAISERSLWSLSKSGQIPTVRMGRCVRFSPADLTAFVQGCKSGLTGK